MSYPGGKSGSGIYQRVINLIPPHDVLIVPFAGHCGIVRNIKPAEHTIVVDADENVCQWWDDWRRSPKGRGLEIHHCDGIEFIGSYLGLSEYSVAITGRSRSRLRPATRIMAFLDPPYILSERAHGKQYQHEMTDEDHRRLAGTMSRIDATQAALIVCGYKHPIYDLNLGNDWRSIDHRVMTRGGLQDERMWLNYQEPEFLHDYRFIGDNKRARERIRRRQRNWSEQLLAMEPHERQAMLEALKSL